MSGSVASQLDEVSKYLDRIREQKRDTETTISSLEREKSNLDAKIEELREKRDQVENRLRVEQNRLARQERTIQQGEVTYNKLLDSSQSLADFVKKEYQENRNN